jgi:outer membrane receptor protein involved in Fe transport
MRSTLRQRLLATTLLFGAATIASPAWAQAQDSSPEPAASSEADPNAGEQDPGSSGVDSGDVIITGSRIARRDLTSTSPLAVVQDEEFSLSGSVNVESVINALPQVVPGATAFSNNPGGGVATLNLRGLGSQRNLVLVNGRRYVFYDPSQVVDLNTIPAFLLDSVDVVTGGASAVYGSDALAGVTNFRLKTDLEGVLAGGQVSLTEDGDGRRYNAYAALGTKLGDGRGNVTIYGEYYNRGAIFQGARDFSRFALSDGATGLVPGGSANVPQGRFVAPASVTVDGTAFNIAAGTNFPGGGAIFTTPGVSVPYVGGAQAFNYAPSNYLMVPQERWTLGGYGEYEVGDGIKLYGEVAFINNRVENELAATPVTQGVNVNLATVCTQVSAADCTQLTTIANNQAAAVREINRLNATRPANQQIANPFGQLAAGTGIVPALSVPATGPATQVRLTANYRVTQIANRNASDDRNAYRMLVGSRGEVFSGVNYDLYYMYSRTKNAQVQEGNISRSAFATNVANGTCNIFGLNRLSDTCIENVSILAQNQEESVLHVAQGSLSGNLFQLPWASAPVGIAGGVEWRKMAASFIPDTALSSGDVVGFNAGDPTSGSYNVKEVFGELRIPIIADSFINRFEISAAGRYSDYSLDAVGTVPTYSIGAELAPVRDITFRAQYQRAVRAPNVQELFGGASVGFPAATDPCSSRTPVANRTEALRALCVATGVPAANVFQTFLQPNDQIEGAFGGNPNLEEEVGDTYTAGFILRPSFIPRLNVAVDYYKIKIANSIAVAGGTVGNVLNLCYNQIQDASSPLCQSISRDAQGVISGGPFIVSAGNANLAAFKAEGVDAQVDYNMPLGFGLLGNSSRLNFYFLGSYTRKNNYTPIVGLDTVECAGKFGLNCGNPTPKYKFSSRLSLLDGPLTTTVRWRYVGATRDDDEDTDYFVERLKAYNLFDLAFSLGVTDTATMTFGINNLFDKKPPIIGSNQEQANTYPGTFDVLGRDLFVSVNFRL